MTTFKEFMEETFDSDFIKECDEEYVQIKKIGLLTEHILNRIDQSAGGMKFMELLADVAEVAADPILEQAKKELLEGTTYLPDSLENFIRENISELSILEYACQIGEIDRVKMFVYRNFRKVEE